MTKKALTVVAVERVRPPARGQIELFDKGFPGLALRVSYAGGKSFGFYYRFGGKLRRINFGTYPAIGLLEAREAWRAARIALAKGDDPGRRDTVTRTDTVEAVVTDWIKRDQVPRNRASTVRGVEGAFRFDVLPAWGSRQIRTIGKRDVIELLDGIMDRGAVVKARRLYAYLCRFFKWAYQREIIPTNPIAGIEKPGKEIARERVLTGDEIAAIWRALGDHGPHGAAARVLLLTGARISEISTVKWSEIDGATIKLEGSRTKNGRPHTIPLSSTARSIIEAMPHVGEYVFTRDGKRPVRGFDKIKIEVDGKTKIADWRWHDFRRVVSTGLHELGVEPHIVEAILGHAVAGVAGVYNRARYDALKAAALQAWGAHVTALVEGRASGKVVALVR